MKRFYERHVMQRLAVFIALSAFLLVAYYPLSQAQDLFNRSDKKTDSPLATDRKSSTDLFVRTTPGSKYRKKTYRSGGLKKTKTNKNVKIPSTWHALSEDVLENRLADMDMAQSLTDEITRKIASDNKKRALARASGTSYTTRTASTNAYQAPKKSRTQSVGGNTIINKDETSKGKKPVQLFNSPNY